MATCPTSGLAGLPGSWGLLADTSASEMQVRRHQSVVAAAAAATDALHLLDNFMCAWDACQCRCREHHLARIRRHLWPEGKCNAPVSGLTLEPTASAGPPVVTIRRNWSAGVHLLNKKDEHELANATCERACRTGLAHESHDKAGWLNARYATAQVQPTSSIKQPPSPATAPSGH